MMTQSNTAKRPTLTLARPAAPAKSVTVVRTKADKVPPAKAAKPAIWIRPVSEYAIANRERCRRTHLELVRRFPACFGEQVKPLAIGIDAQLFEACPDIDRHALMFFLGEYTSTADYHRAMIAEPDRIDLNGVPVSAVTPSSVAYAERKLKTSTAP